MPVKKEPIPSGIQEKRKKNIIREPVRNPFVNLFTVTSLL